MKKQEEQKTKLDSPQNSESPNSKSSWFDFSEISLFGEKKKTRLSLTSAFRYEAGSALLHLISFKSEQREKMLGSARSSSSFAFIDQNSSYIRNNLPSRSSGSGSSRSRSPEAEATGPKADLVSRQLLTLVDKQSVEFVAKTKKKNFAPEEFGEVITSFYDALADAIRTKEDDDETVATCMDRAEANITSEIYHKLFAQEEDEALDIGTF